jgi:hypothetical protein
MFYIQTRQAHTNIDMGMIQTELIDIKTITLKTSSNYPYIYASFVQVINSLQFFLNILIYHLSHAYYRHFLSNPPLFHYLNITSYREHITDLLLKIHAQQITFAFSNKAFSLRQNHPPLRVEIVHI